jgi:hypothetical protein
MEENLPLVGVPEGLEALRHLHGAERSNYWEAANMLTKSMAFYIAISAGVLGYALTQKLPPPFPRQIGRAARKLTHPTLRN